MGCALLLLTGDVAYAAIGTSGDLTGPRLLDLPFLLAFALLGASALHPSMAELCRDAPVPVQAHAGRSSRSWPAPAAGRSPGSRPTAIANGRHLVKTVDGAERWDSGGTMAACGTCCDALS
jgi:hypothetical protein